MSTTSKPLLLASASPSDGGQEGESLASQDLGAQEGQLLLRLEEGVRIFFITPEGDVTSPEGETFLEVITFKSPQAGSAEGFLQVGEWIYPLMKERSPVLQSYYGSFIFPELRDSKLTQFVGVSLPSDVTEETHQQLVDLLGKLAVMTKQESDDVDGAKTEKALQLFAATTRVTTVFMVWGSAKMCKVIEQKSDDIEQSTPRAGEVPSVPVKEVDPQLHKLGEKAVKVTTVTVKVTDAAVAQVNRVTAWLAKSLAPTVKQTAAAVATNLTGKHQDPEKLLTSDTGVLVSEAVRSTSAMCKAMELAAFLLAGSLGDNTVRVVTHMYGPDAGRLASTTAAALLQTATTGDNMLHLSSGQADR